MYMVKKYGEFINEEVGVRNMKSIASKYSEAEIYFHQDLDGVTSALAMKNFIERYNIKVVDCHIIQYGGIEYAVKNTTPGRMPVLVDFAHSKPFFVIATDHHDKQTGAEGNSATYFKPSRSNVETISGEISPSDVFTTSDINLIKTVDSADFMKYGIKPDDIQNAVFSIDPELSGEKNRFMMGFVVNRLLLVFKNKRITVKSLDGKRDHINRNFLECLVLDCNPSLISMFINIQHYMNNAMSLEWDRNQRKHNVPKRLATSDDISNNLQKYVKSRIDSKDIQYDPKYKIVSQYGIGYVMDSGSYDRYVVFKNNPDADFVCTIFPMGLIQVSCNPFKEKALKDINIGAITVELLDKYKTALSNIYIAVSDIKRISEDEVSKMKTKYGAEYEPIGFTFDDLKAFYKGRLQYLPNRKSGDMRTKEALDLDQVDNQIVKDVMTCMNKPYSSWTSEEKSNMSWIKIDVFSIIKVNSGGHPSITNIQGLNYLGTRSELLGRVFGEALRVSLGYNNFDNIEYMDVMKLLGHDFLNILREKIDLSKSGKQVFYQKSDIELEGGIANESFEYFLKSKDGDEMKVTKDEFIKTGFNSRLIPKNKDDDGKKFLLDIDKGKIIGKFE